MLYIREAEGAVRDVVGRLERAVGEHRFGVLGRIDLKARMAEKGVPLAYECVILEVYNPKQADKVLELAPAASALLPCRISVYGGDGKAAVATVRPTELLSMYEGAEALKPVAEEVENALVAIIDSACDA